MSVKKHAQDGVTFDTDVIRHGDVVKLQIEIVGVDGRMYERPKRVAGVIEFKLPPLANEAKEKSLTELRATDDILYNDERYYKGT